MSRRLRCAVAYDGSDFQGWQVQPGLRTVQAEIERAFGILEGREGVRIHGSGRTDAGVHARGQVFHVDAIREYPPEKWRESLNGLLPEDVRILEVRAAPENFHARFSCVGKEYRYRVYNGPVCPPDLRRTRHAVRRPLAEGPVREAMRRLVGEHDFRSFSAVRVEAEENTVRTLRRFDLDIRGDEWVFTAEADGFLYKMVRQLAGAVLRVGLGDLTPGEVGDLLARPRLGHEAPTAPARGLFLWRVDYPD